MCEQKSVQVYDRKLISFLSGVVEEIQGETETEEGSGRHSCVGKKKGRNYFNWQEENESVSTV